MNKKFIAGAKKLGKELAERRKAAGLPYRPYRSKARLLLATINVIEYLNGEIVKLASFPETTKGNEAAEKHFRKVAAEILKTEALKNVASANPRWVNDMVPIALDNGVAEFENRKIVIFHSTVGQGDESKEQR